MDDRLRKHIENNVEKLIKSTDYDRVMESCMTSGLLNPAMKKNIESLEESSENITPSKKKDEQHKRLFLKLTKRGPEAYEKLKIIMEELKFTDALELLSSVYGNEISIRSVKSHLEKEKHQTLDKDGGCYSMHRNVDDIELRLFTSNIPENYKFDVKKEKNIIKEKFPCYKMQSEHNRGVLLLVNIMNFDYEDKRTGSEYDTFRLLHLYRELGFKLFQYDDLTKNAFFSLLQKFINSKYAKETECFTLVLMTHGKLVDHKEFLIFRDGSKATVNEILKLFANDKCPNLYTKPKIFIFQFCRGNQYQGVFIQTDGGGYIYDHRYSDILICYTCSPGHASMRDTKGGTWYIQNFCDIMAEHAHEWHFTDIVKMTQRRTGSMRDEENKLQAGTNVNWDFNKHLYFNLGAHTTSTDVPS